MGKKAPPGLRIHEYLAQRADVEVLRIAARAPQGQRRTRTPAQRRRRGLLVPARRGVARGRRAGHQPRTCLIDASTAHRTVPGWAFGLPELAPGQRDALRASKRIANPGCHASAFILLLRPLVDAGLVPAAHTVSPRPSPATPVVARR
jgi:N-acetyl-gamma-glutamyl-phosphate reductase